jgi:hypothetical protein
MEMHLLTGSEDTIVAGSGDLKALIWVKRERCRMDRSTFEAAARSGDLKMVNWLDKQGCPWDLEPTCSAAASSGNLEILKWIYTATRDTATGDDAWYIMHDVLQHEDAMGYAYSRRDFGRGYSGYIVDSWRMHQKPGIHFLKGVSYSSLGYQIFFHPY